MKKKKWLSGSLSLLTTLSMAFSALVLPASAEESHVRLTVRLTGDFRVSDNADELCYPSIVSRTDITNFTLTGASGTVYASNAYDNSVQGKTVVFDDVHESDLTSLSLSFETDTFAVPVPDGVPVEWYALEDGSGWKKGTVKLNVTNLQRETTKESQSQAQHASSLDELDTITPEYTGNYTISLPVSLEPCGVSSVMVAYNPDGDYTRKSNSTYFSDRATYGIKDVINYEVLVGGKAVASAMMPNGVFYFTMPANAEGESVQLTISGFYNGSDIIYKTTFDFDEYEGSPFSANNKIRVLNIDSETIFADEDVVDADTELEDDTDDSTIGDEAAEDMGGVRYDINSSLSKYDLSLVSNIDTWFNLVGAPTESIKLMYAEGEEIPSSMSYGGFDLATNKSALISLEKGTYNPIYSDLLNISGASDVNIKGTTVTDAKLSVTPKYTLEVAGTGNLDYVIDDIPFKTESGYLFALDCDIPHYITDNTSGKQYEVIATSDKPNLKITLGSDVGVIGSVDPTAPDGTAPFEDVPNTADGITILFLIPIGILIPAVCLGIIFFVRNKRVNGGK